MSQPFFILSLDGGGSLGVYTLGVLVEIERMLKCPLHKKFTLIYGTSTGSIIASMIALGDGVETTIRKRYFEIAPDVMGRFSGCSRSAALHRHARKIYGEKTFEEFKVNVGIVATHLEYNRPRVFKRLVSQAHGRSSSFKAGFGVKISDAVIASCAAYPFFKTKLITTPDHGEFMAVDGGFTANNPTLFALADALGPLAVHRKDIRILSIGTGSYPAKRRLISGLLTAIRPTKTFMTLLRTSSNTVEKLLKLFFPDIETLRIDGSFSDSSYKTDFMESDPRKLKKIFQLGRESFGKVEPDLRSFFTNTHIPHSTN